MESGRSANGTFAKDGRHSINDPENSVSLTLEIIADSGYCSRVINSIPHKRRFGLHRATDSTSSISFWRSDSAPHRFSSNTPVGHVLCFSLERIGGRFSSKTMNRQVTSDRRLANWGDNHHAAVTTPRGNVDKINPYLSTRLSRTINCRHQDDSSNPVGGPRLPCSPSTRHSLVHVRADGEPSRALAIRVRILTPGHGSARK